MSFEGFPPESTPSDLRHHRQGLPSRKRSQSCSSMFSDGLSRNPQAPPVTNFINQRPHSQILPPSSRRFDFGFAPVDQADASGQPINANGTNLWGTTRHGPMQSDVETQAISDDETLSHLDLGSVPVSPSFHAGSSPSEWSFISTTSGWTQDVMHSPFMSPRAHSPFATIKDLPSQSTSPESSSCSLLGGPRLAMNPQLLCVPTSNRVEHPSSPNWSSSSSSPASHFSKLGLHSPGSSNADLEDDCSAWVLGVQGGKVQETVPSSEIEARIVEPDYGSPSRTRQVTESIQRDMLRTFSAAGSPLRMSTVVCTANTDHIPTNIHPTGNGASSSIPAPYQSFPSPSGEPYQTRFRPSSPAPAPPFSSQTEPFPPNSDWHQLELAMLQQGVLYSHLFQSVPVALTGPPLSLSTRGSGAGPASDIYGIRFGEIVTSPIDTPSEFLTLGTSGPEASDIPSTNDPGPSNLSNLPENGAEGLNGNFCLHVSIDSLEASGRISRAATLKETIRFIILQCFNSNPTRQEIVNILFDALPEDLRLQVSEQAVKKYFKDRIGHILSAPANKTTFINLRGRWSVAEQH